ncbi:MAG: hypothetical protein JRN62_06115 [Nitrososphaerota archaeon]|jgi:hypothetical protein|nr:hypothetical protein [Nitrososphaerota archaeon]
MTLHDALSELVTHVDKLVRWDAERGDDPISPSILRKVPMAIYHLYRYEPVKAGEETLPVVQWSMSMGEGYPSKSVDEFVRVITNSDAYGSALKALDEHKRGEWKGVIERLYLTCFSYATLGSVLTSTAASELARLTESFIADVNENSLHLKFSTGLAGVLIPEGEVAFAGGPILREIRKEDYHDDSEPTNGQSPREMGFPSDYRASTVLTFHGAPDPGQAEGPLGMFDIRLHVPERDFDLTIEGARVALGKWEGTIPLLQAGYPPKRFYRLEIFLPHFRGDVPVYRWEERLKLGTDRGQITFRRSDGNTISLSKRLVEADYGSRLYPRDGRTTPLSESYQKYIGMLTEVGTYEKTIHEATVALENLFTPESVVMKQFIPRVTTLVRLTGVDTENNLSNILANAWRIRSDYSHRGEGWSEDSESKANSTMARVLWEGYKRELAGILETYLRLSLVTRILSGLSDQEFVEGIDWIQGGGTNPKISAACAGMNASIGKITDFVPDKYAVEEYGLSLEELWKEADEGRIPAINVEAPHLDVRYLIPEGQADLVRELRSERDDSRTA